jgi:FkbM family methyltransferase
MTSDFNIPRGNITSTFELLRKSGVPISAIIDVGCADGSFSLMARSLFGKSMRALNLDAQAIYEPSLRTIQEKTGAFYKISGLSSFAGRLNWNTNEGSPYWSQAGGKSDSIPCQPLDEIVEEFPLFGPFFIKMDIEGGEFDALLGARKTLQQTSALMLECDIWYGPNGKATFVDLCAYLAARNFSLFDINGLGYRNGDAALFQIYATWLNREYEFRHLPVAAEAAQGGTPSLGLPSGDALAAAMDQRRKNLLQQNAQLLEQWDSE